MIGIDEFKSRAATAATQTQKAAEDRQQNWRELRALCIASGFPEPHWQGGTSNVVIHDDRGQLVMDAPIDLACWLIRGYTLAAPEPDSH